MSELARDRYLLARWKAARTTAKTAEVSYGYDRRTAFLTSLDAINWIRKSSVWPMTWPCVLRDRDDVDGRIAV